MRVIIFGLGLYYNNRKDEIHKILGNDEIVAYMDSNSEYGEYSQFQPFCSLDECEELLFDIIIVTSTYYVDIKENLRIHHIPDEKIIPWEKFLCYRKNDQLTVYTDGKENAKRILIISSALGFDGAPMVVYSLALVLIKMGYKISILAEAANEKYIYNAQEQGIDVLLYPRLAYFFPEEVKVNEFDHVIVNTVIMINSAYTVSRRRRVIWWIHEGKDEYTGNYRKSKFLISDVKDKNWMRDVSIYAVSGMACKNFNGFYPDIPINVWVPGIPDEKEIKVGNKTNLIFTIAIIGGISPLKGQDILLDAIDMMRQENKLGFCALIIGKYGNKSDYEKKILAKAKSIPQIKLTGAITNEELYKIYPQIDIVVCASREETLSLAIVEGMMFGKVCITTDATGVAEYIENGKNGFIVPTGDAAVLRECLVYVQQHWEECRQIAIEGRNTYEKYFSTEVFEERTKAVLDEVGKVHI